MGASNTRGVYKFRDFLSNHSRSGRRCHVAAATKGVTNISFPWKNISYEKLCHTKIYASGSGRHHRCAICFLSPESPPRENLMLLLCVCCC